MQIVKELGGNESGAEEDLLLKDRAIAHFLQIKKIRTLIRIKWWLMENA